MIEMVWWRHALIVTMLMNSAAGLLTITSSKAVAVGLLRGAEGPFICIG